MGFFFEALAPNNPFYSDPFEILWDVKKQTTRRDSTGGGVRVGSDECNKCINSWLTKQFCNLRLEPWLFGSQACAFNYYLTAVHKDKGLSGDGKLVLERTLALDQPLNLNSFSTTDTW